MQLAQSPIVHLAGGMSDLTFVVIKICKLNNPNLSSLNIFLVFSGNQPQDYLPVFSSTDQNVSGVTEESGPPQTVVLQALDILWPDMPQWKTHFANRQESSNIFP
jgi:hypothetical protein